MTGVRRVRVQQQQGKAGDTAPGSGRVPEGGGQMLAQVVGGVRGEKVGSDGDSGC